MKNKTLRKHRRPNLKILKFHEQINIPKKNKFFGKRFHFHYLRKNETNWLSGIIFWGFGVLFFTLGILIFFKTVNYMCSIFFTHCLLIKNFVNVSCLFLGIAGFTLGYAMTSKRHNLLISKNIRIPFPIPNQNEYRDQSLLKKHRLSLE